jgi:hypothetical protein
VLFSLLRSDKSKLNYYESSLMIRNIKDKFISIHLRKGQLRASQVEPLQRDAVSRLIVTSKIE